MAGKVVAVLLFSLIKLAYYVAILGIFVAYVHQSGGDDESSDGLSAGSASAKSVLTYAAFGIVLVGYVVWETAYGSAFSYFFPLHGAARVANAAWRFGTFVKTAFVATTIALLVDVVLTRNITGAINGMRTLSPISQLTSLLVPACFAFPVLVIFVYAVGGQYARRAHVYR